MRSLFIYFSLFSFFIRTFASFFYFILEEIFGFEDEEALGCKEMVRSLAKIDFGI